MTTKRNQIRNARLKLMDEVGKMADEMTMLEDRLEAAEEQVQALTAERDWYHAELRGHLSEYGIARRKAMRQKTK